MVGAHIYGSSANELTFLAASSELEGHRWNWHQGIALARHDVVRSCDAADVKPPVVVALFLEPEETGGPPLCTKRLAVNLRYTLRPDQTHEVMHVVKVAWQLMEGIEIWA